MCAFSRRSATRRVRRIASGASRGVEMNKLFPQHSDHPLFRYFTDDERRKIERIGEVKTVRANDYLIRARAHDSNVYTVEEGHLDIVAKETGVANVGPRELLCVLPFTHRWPST